MEKTARAPGQRTFKGKKGGELLTPREKGRLIQLAVCLVLFLTVFYAKGAGRMNELRAQLETAINSNADFQTALTDIRWYLNSGEPLGKAAEVVWNQLFLAHEKPPEERAGESAYCLAVQRELSAGGSVTAVPLLWENGAEETLTDPMAGSHAVAEPAEVEPAVVYVEYNGPALPKNTTMDRYALGLKETVTPVMGVMTSDFGWREHPIDGKDDFHLGVDLAVDTGTDILAFAEGVVDYIGESDSYGQYLQLRHDNGVTSFYAHCSKLCVQQGQTVAAGEKVAESGETGRVTGPHLHFELKLNGTRLEPLYYIETLT